MNPDGTGITSLTNNEGYDAHPDISPDGKIIAYEGKRDEIYSWQVYAINANGTGLVRLTAPPGQSGQPAWSLDGSKIVFSSNRSGNWWNIYVMNADGIRPDPPYHYFLK